MGEEKLDGGFGGTLMDERISPKEVDGDSGVGGCYGWNELDVAGVVGPYHILYQPPPKGKNVGGHGNPPQVIGEVVELYLLRWLVEVVVKIISFILTIGLHTTSLCTISSLVSSRILGWGCRVCWRSRYTNWWPWGRPSYFRYFYILRSRIIPYFIGYSLGCCEGVVLLKVCWVY